jgi:uncharacterized protein YkwD/tRNA A-37 threonylcarbamoyl transferase component Bud32
MATRNPSNLPPELAGNPHYEILGALGGGGMGLVYKARHRLSGRLEVLKVMNKDQMGRPESRQRFLQEIQSAARLDHPNVVKMYTALALGELMVLAMEYVEGENLAALVRSRGPLPVVNAVNYVQQAAIGLQHAFEKGMVHRDVKPQNLILAHEGKRPVVKVLDFGLAKAMRESEQSGRRLTKVGETMGTPEFIAPEQTHDAARADIRADIYSLGCTLYYLLAGQPPFTVKDPAALLRAHQATEAPPLNLVRAEVSPALAAVVRKMMAKSPAQRYQTPAEVVQALTAAVKPAAKGPPPITPPAVEGRSPTARKPSRNRLVALAILGLLLIGMLGLSAGALWMWSAGMFEAAPTEGTLVVEANEPNPDVYVDGEKAAAAWTEGGRKTEVRVKAGTRKVDVKKEGFTSDGKELSIAAGGRGVFVARLMQIQAKPRDGVIAITVNEPNPDVYVDGANASAAWTDGGRKTEVRVTPGRRRVEIKKTGFRPVSRELLVAEGGREALSAELSPDAARPSDPPTARPKEYLAVMYPAAGQKNVPLLFVPELPDPLPKEAGPAGYPITITFPAEAGVESVGATLEDNASGRLDVWLSTPTSPALTRGQQGNTICLIPKAPLQPHRTYAVTVEARVGGSPWKRHWDFTTGAAGVGETTLASAVLTRLNHHRQAADLKRAVVNRALSLGCTDHARYVARNAEYLSIAGSLRDEEVGRPGFTEEGRKAARQSIVSGRRRHPRDVIDDWMAAPLLRPLLLSPVLDGVGIGTETEVRMGWATVLALPPPTWPPDTGPVLYPSDQQKDVPLAVYSLVSGDKYEAAGYPITITFRPSARIKDARVKLANAMGEEVAAWSSGPETPAAQQLSQPNTICLLPREHLRPAKTYSVSATASVNGVEWTRAWKFTTEGSADVAAVGQAVLARVNAHRAAAGLEPVALDPSLSRGCGLHAHYLVLNADAASAQGEGMHDEDRSLPGYTLEGERAGKHGVLTTHFDPPDSVDAWVGSFFHRLPFLDRNLKRIGLGYEKGGLSQGWMTVVDYH